MLLREVIFEKPKVPVFSLLYPTTSSSLFMHIWKSCDLNDSNETLAWVVLDEFECDTCHVIFVILIEHDVSYFCNYYLSFWLSSQGHIKKYKKHFFTNFQIGVQLIGKWRNYVEKLSGTVFFFVHFLFGKWLPISVKNIVFLKLVNTFFKLEYSPA